MPIDMVNGRSAASDRSDLDLRVCQPLLQIADPGALESSRITFRSRSTTHFRVHVSDGPILRDVLFAAVVVH